jgi:hypothetical protein
MAFPSVETNEQVPSQLLISTSLSTSFPAQEASNISSQPGDAEASLHLENGIHHRNVRLRGYTY